jgi:hypothetical protein
MTNAATAFATYYGFGLLWLGSGIVTGWLQYRGEPVAVAGWIMVKAVIWPFILFRLIRDVARGIHNTDITDL